MGRQGGLTVSQRDFFFSGVAVEGTDLQGALCIKNLYSKKKEENLRILFVFRRALLISCNHMLVLRPIQMKVLFVYFYGKIRF